MQTVIPHAAIGLSQCRGFLYGRVTGQNALIACNDCAIILRIVPAADLQPVLDDIKMELDLARAISRYRQTIDLLPPGAVAATLMARECEERTGAARTGLPAWMN